MTVNWVATKGPKTRRMAEARFHQLIFLSAMESDAGFLESARREIPEAWQTLEMDIDARPPKEKVSLYLDRAVIAMFRKMGQGYQARINRILETWLQMKIAEKAVYQRDVMEALGDAIAEKNREDPGDFMKEQYAKLVEHWAYEEGFRDGLRKSRNHARAAER
ncbi:MAG: BrnA antitoxin family protein [Silicimonas sp.]|nr:BrnA antitoxin family protein [Silicimonas sp.]